MSIDARIQAVRNKPNKHILWLEGRKKGERPGQRELHIAHNPNYTPQVGDEIWGNCSSCMIGKHEFRRIMRLYDGTEETL